MLLLLLLCYFNLILRICGDTVLVMAILCDLIVLQHRGPFISTAFHQSNMYFVSPIFCNVYQDIHRTDTWTKSFLLLGYIDILLLLLLFIYHSLMLRLGWGDGYSIMFAHLPWWFHQQPWVLMLADSLT